MSVINIAKIIEYRNRKNNLNPCTGAALKGLAKEFRDSFNLSDKDALQILSDNTTTDDMLAILSKYSAMEESAHISKQALHNKIFKRMEAEVPQSRAHLGGYHTGKRDAYLNVIADLKEAPSDQGEVQLTKSEQACIDAHNGTNEALLQAELDDERRQHQFEKDSHDITRGEVQRLRTALEQIEEILADDTAIKAQRINRIIEESLSPQLEKGE